MTKLSKRVAKVGAGLVLLTVLGFLFLRSVRGTLEGLLATARAAGLGQFRQRLAAEWNDGVAPNAFDPARLSPALIIATVESTAQSWPPLNADPKVDCVAPITISSAAE